MNVYDRMIFDINRRTIIDKNRNFKSKAQHEFKQTQFFKRMEEDMNRRTVSKQKMTQFYVEQQEKELEKILPSKKIPKSQQEATFSRLIADVNNRQEVFEMRKKIKELSEIEASRDIKDHLLTKEQALSVAQRLQEYGKRKWQNIEIKKKIQEERELEEIQLLKSHTKSKKESDQEAFDRLTRPKSPVSLQEPIDAKLFSIKDAIASGSRLMNAHGNKLKVGSTTPDPPKLSISQLSGLVSRLYSPSQSVQPTPRGQSSIDTLMRPNSVSHTTQASPSRREISPEDKSGSSANDFHRKPIELRLKKFENDLTLKQLLPVRRQTSEIVIEFGRQTPSALETYKALGGMLDE